MRTDFIECILIFCLIYSEKVVCFRMNLVSNQFMLYSSRVSSSKLEATSYNTKLLDWCVAQGSRKEDCPVGFVTSSNGEIAEVVASKPIKSGDSLFSLPQSLSLDIKKAVSKFGDYLSVNNLRTKDLGMLALLLMSERFLGEKSKYHEYIQSLPAKTIGILSYNEEQLSSLYKSTTRSINRFVASFQADLELISKLSFPDTLLPFTKSPQFEEYFRWAMSIVKSRSFYIERQLVLLPGMDSIAFDPFSENEPMASGAGFFGGKVFKVIADRNYQIEDPVYLSYGVKSSAECLEDHGFVPEVSQNNLESTASCEIEVNITDDDKFSDDKINILEDNKFRRRMKYDLSADPNIGIDPDLIRFLRLKFISGKDAFILESCFGSTVFYTMTKPFSKNNELMVFEYIYNFCQQELDKLNSVSTVEQDEAMLASVSANSKQKPGSGTSCSPEAMMAKLRRQERGALKVTMNIAFADILNIKGPADFRDYYQERRLRELDLLRPLDESEIIAVD